jgi:outer membrane lipoprotein-sorting protein
MNPETPHVNDEPLDRAVAALRATPVPAGPPPEVLDAVRAAGADNQEPRRRSLRERIASMNRLTKFAATLAAAAAVVLATGAAFFLWSGGHSGNLVLADVIKELNVRTARFFMMTTMTPPMPNAPPANRTEVLWMEPGLMRCNQDGAMYQVLNLKTGKFMVVMPEQKKVMMLDMKGQLKAEAGPGNVSVGVPDKAAEADRDFFGKLRRLVNEVRGSRPDEVQALGERVIGGRRAIGFHKKNYERGADLELWADMETHLPALVIITTSITIDGAASGLTVTMSDFEFDVPLEAGLFSLEVPPGFTVESRTLDATVPGEAEFAAGLGRWAEMQDGAFPAKLDVYSAAAVMARNIASQMAAKEEAGSLPPDEAAAPEMPSQEMMDEAMKVQRVIIFISKLTTDKIDWAYVGNGVRLGEATKPIFWYRPAGAATYRVIYGDLSIRDLAPAALPPATDAQRPDATAELAPVSVRHGTITHTSKSGADAGPSKTTGD